MYDHAFPNLQVTRSDIRPHKRSVILVIAHGQCHLPQEFVWVCMDNILTLSPPRDGRGHSMFRCGNGGEKGVIHSHTMY